MGSNREKVKANPITIRIFLVSLQQQSDNSTTSYISSLLYVIVNERIGLYRLWFDVEKRYETIGYIKNE